MNTCIQVNFALQCEHQQMKTASCGAENTAEAYLPHSERVTVEARNDSIYFYPMRQAGLFVFSEIDGAL